MDVQAHVVNDDRLTQRRQNLVHERLAQILGQMLDVRAEHDCGEELPRVLGLRGRRREPALGGAEARGQEPSLGLLRSGVVLGWPPVAEVLGVGVACEYRVGGPAQNIDVALSPTLGHQLSCGAQHCLQAPEEALVIWDPMERRRR